MSNNEIIKDLQNKIEFMGKKLNADSIRDLVYLPHRDMEMLFSFIKVCNYYIEEDRNDQ